MEQEARKKQKREEEKRKTEAAAAKANHEQTIEGENQAVNDVVENSQSVAADTDPSISGVVNGNPLSKDLEGNQKSTSTSDTENDEGSAHFNAVNKKNLEKVLLRIYNCRKCFQIFWLRMNCFIYNAQYYTASRVYHRVLTILQEPREVLKATATTNKQPQGEDSDHVAKD